MDRVDEMGPQNLREITFPYRRLRYEDISRYPYVDKLSIPGWNTKNNPVSIDFIYQFATKSISYHCINDEKHCSCYVADIFGPPTVHLDDGCKKRTPNRSYSSFSNSLESNGMHYINLEYHEAVYPLRISVFGDSDFPVGFRSRIWAKDSDDKWSLLWDTNSDVIYKYKRTVVAERLIFSTTRPPYYFKTKMLRLEFTCSLLQLHSKLTAVMLAGTSDLIFPRRLEPSNPHCVFNLLDKINPCPCRPIQNYEFALNIITLESKNILQWKTPLIRFCLTKNVIQWNLWNYYVICESEIVESCHKCVLGYKHISQKIEKECLPDFAQCFMEIYKHCTSHKNYLNYEKFLEDLQLLWKESKKPITCSFPQLPDEIIIKIFSCLDLKSLSRISRVNKRLNNLSQDPKFYKSLNIRNIHYTYWRFSFDDIFLYFASRCKYLTQVDLSFCTFSVSAFNKFLATCGKLLTDLRLNNCPLINDSAVHQISTICRNLKGLDLNGCNCVNDQGLSYLINLESLERLHLENVKALNAVTVCKILQSNRQMRDLNLARMCSILNLNEIAIRLKTLCPNLERINLAKTNLPSKAIDALADCKNLQEVNFRNAWTNCGYTPSLRDSFHRLFSSCQRLEKIDLSFNHLLPSYVLETLTLCKNLKCLMLIKVTSVTPATLRDTCFEILLQCPKLEEIYLPFMVTNILTDHWNERYQNLWDIAKWEANL